MLTVFAALSAILAIIAAPPYILDTLRGKTKPERATWIIYSALGLIGFFSSLSIESNWSLVYLGVDTLASLSVLALSIPYGVGGWTLLDRYALSTALVGAAISVVIHRPLIALGGNILADVAGTVITIRKAYLHPSTETTVSWVLVGVGGVFGTLAVGKLDLALLLWPAYLAMANLAIPLAQNLGRAAGHR